MRYLSLLGVFLASILSACSSPEPTTNETGLTEWLNHEYAHQLTFSPVQLSRSGDHSRHGEIDEVSEAAFLEQMEWKRSSVERMEQKFDYKQLSDDEQLSYDLWAFQYEQMQRGAEFRHLEYVFEQMIGPQSRLPQVLIGSHDVHTMQDMGDYNKRIRAIAERINELVAIAQHRAADGLRPPRFAYQEVVRQAEAVISGAPFTDGDESPIWQDAQSKVAQLAKQDIVNQRNAELLLEDTQAALTDALYPAYKNLIDWLHSDLPNTLSNPEGISRHQGGAAYYEYLLWFYTTTDLNAEQIHQIGLDEVARLTTEMELIRERVGFEGDLQDFFHFFREDEQFFYPNTDEGREAYLQQARDYLAIMDEQMPNFFGLLPEIPLQVRRVEAYREQAGAPQHYMRGSPGSGRPGIFYAHLIDMQAMAKPELEAIAYHEGVPGHHQQISVAQQASDIPDFRTQARFTVFTEGWALYAEWLAKEMGAYQDPYSEFGQLVTELWRAVRLVVDTGLHSKGWTREDAIDYFATTTPVSAGAIQTEIERYMTLPGQATSFKIGMIKIQQLRREAESALGDDFDIRRFHDAVLGGGAMPLPMLERKIEQWIASELE